MHPTSNTVAETLKLFTAVAKLSVSVVEARVGSLSRILRLALQFHPPTSGAASWDSCDRSG
ncbi:hypothetical protein ACX80E_14905 [Arthrobacter sp. TMN-49]